MRYLQKLSTSAFELIFHPAVLQKISGGTWVEQNKVKKIKIRNGWFVFALLHLELFITTGDIANWEAVYNTETENRMWWFANVINSFCIRSRAKHTNQIFKSRKRNILRRAKMSFWEWWQQHIFKKSGQGHAYLCVIPSSLNKSL